jgi:translation elongation factor EF-Ts
MSTEKCPIIMSLLNGLRNEIKVTEENIFQIWEGIYKIGDQHDPLAKNPEKQENIPADTVESMLNHYLKDIQLQNQQLILINQKLKELVG